jgi:hypothetical protein
MDWQSQLVSMYITVSDLWKKEIFLYGQRRSNNANSFITDEEILTIFFFAITQGALNVTSAYQYANNHLRDWFPRLKDYGAFNYRLNRLAEIFPIFLEGLQTSIESHSSFFTDAFRIIDSCPILLAKQKRSEGAKVASDFATKGYCASRGEYYYGVKLHIVGVNTNGSIPIPEVIQLTPANIHDLTLLKEICPHYRNMTLYADKAYLCAEFQKEMKARYNIKMMVPIKKKQGQELTMFEKIESAAISKLRQPIESFFNWLNEKTGIQKGSKIRSSNGLLVHVFGRLSVALILIKMGGLNF